MKTFKLLVVGIMLMLAGTAQSQLSVNVHIGSPPAWGPAGYSDVRYYYLPDVEAYYDVDASMFIYISGNRWIRRSYLPGRYRNYDLYHGYKVVMNDYHGNAPYSRFREHRMKYARGYRGAEQHNVGPRNDRNNNQSRQHQEVRENRNDNRPVERQNAQNSQVWKNEKNNGHGDKRNNDNHDNNGNNGNNGNGKRK
jgi:hypothetical protein